MRFLVSIPKRCFEVTKPENSDIFCFNVWCFYVFLLPTDVPSIHGSRADPLNLSSFSCPQQGQRFLPRRTVPAPLPALLFRERLGSAYGGNADVPKNGRVLWYVKLHTVMSICKLNMNLRKRTLKENQTHNFGLFVLPSYLR